VRTREEVEEQLTVLNEVARTSGEGTEVLSALLWVLGEDEVSPADYWREYLA
jgi:hypothetical protein